MEQSRRFPQKPVFIAAVGKRGKEEGQMKQEE